MRGFPQRHGVWLEQLTVLPAPVIRVPINITSKPFVAAYSAIVDSQELHSLQITVPSLPETAGYITDITTSPEPSASFFFSDFAAVEQPFIFWLVNGVSEL